MSTRRKRTPSEYRSSVLEILGLSGPSEYAVTTTKVVPPTRYIPTFDDLETAPAATPRPPTTRPDGDDIEQEGGLVQRLWTAAEGDGDLGVEDWAPETPIDRVVGRYRWAWWPVLIGIFIIGVVLVVSTLRGIPVGQAEDLRREWVGDIIELQADLPAAENAAAIITEASPGPKRLTNARASLIGFNTSGAAIDASTGRPFPNPPPLASRSVFDELKPIQDDLQQAVQLTEDVDDALADALTYRELVNQSFKLPSLPIVGDEVTIGDLGRQIASTLSFSRESARQLPISPEYDQHRATVESLVDRLESWQASYLDALRLGDIDGATSLKVEITDRIAAVRSTLGEPLAAVGISVDAQITELSDLLARSRAALEAG